MKFLTFVAMSSIILKTGKRKTVASKAAIRRAVIEAFSKANGKAVAMQKPSLKKAS